MLIKQLTALVVGIALIVAVYSASAGVAGVLATLDAPTGQTIACNSSGHSGGGC